MNVFNGRKLLAQCFWQATGDFVLTDADGFRHILQCVLGNKVILALTEQQPDRGIALRVLDDAIHRRLVEIELSGILRLKLASFQLDHHIATQVEVVEQEVDIKVIAAHIEMILIAKESKAGAKFQ